MKLLHIDSSALGEQSASRALTRRVTAQWAAGHPGTTVEYLDLATQATGGMSGSRSSTWTDGCRWSKDGDFSFDVDVDIARRKRFDDSITRAQEWTAYSLETLREYNVAHTVQVEELTWDIGDETYLAVSSREVSQGKQQYVTLTMLARVGNVVIRVQQSAFAPRERTPTNQELKDALGQFREPAKTLFDDIKEDLR